MSNLDLERRERQQAREAALGDRTFTFGGEQFTHVRDCPWDVIERASSLESAPQGNVLPEMRKLVVELIEPGAQIILPHEIDKEQYVALAPQDKLQYRAVPDKEDTWQVYDPNTGRYENHERFNDLLRRREDPITVDDVSALLRWLMAAASGRPTLPSPPSGDTPPSSGIESTAPSSPPQVAASTS